MNKHLIATFAFVCFFGTAAVPAFAATVPVPLSPGEQSLKAKLTDVQKKEKVVKSNIKKDVAKVKAEIKVSKKARAIENKKRVALKKQVRSAAVTACMNTASSKRSEALKATKETYAAALASANDAHKAALASAKAMTDKIARNAAEKSADKAWRDAKAKALADRNAAMKVSTSTFSADRKICNGIK